ncbi:type II toxin-antitoxin system HicA family toxin [Paenarthrobacter sp. NPDC090520]|uniref:type II toxin-antitoxin system HicA family toxin n=1 Tax=Paenarthrobacter sp. NPDC090520 TaxID=3364382 RepID=UPI0038240104
MKAQKKRDVLKVLKANGWQLVRTTGGHEWWEGPDGQGEPIPRHNEISPGVIRKLAKKLSDVPPNWK